MKKIPANGLHGETQLREAVSEYRAIIELVSSAVAGKLYPGKDNAWANVQAIYPDRVVVINDGRLFALPYTINEANEVTVGDAQEVTIEHKPVDVREAQGVFLEAQDEKGLRWRIRVIKSGLSGNRWFYPDAVLREAISLFNGARVFVKSDKEHLDGEGKDFRNLIGQLSNAKFIEGKKTDTGEVHADLDLLASAGDVPAKMLEAWNRNMASNLFGFSIDAVGRAKPKDNYRVATTITKVKSVDLIVEPGAGGELVNLIEAANSELEASDMTIRARMIEAVKKANKGKLPEGLNVDNDDALETAYREAIKDEVSPEPASGITRDDLDMVEVRAHLREALAESNLPAKAKERVKGSFADRQKFTKGDIDAAITAEREYVANFTESGHVQGLGTNVAIFAGESRAEKVAEMLDAFFDPNHKNHRDVRSFREAYIDITGDRRVTGRLDDCDRARLREAVGDAVLRESLDSASFANVLGNSITRRMIADYRTANQYDAWRPICSVVPVSDFRTQERTRWGGYGDLPAVAQGANYAALTSPTDEKATYTVSKRGGTEDVTLEMIKNDDVGMIQKIPTRLSRAAKRTLAKFVFDFIRLNPAIYDSVALFHADHGNLGTAALDATSLSARKLAMLKQTELSSADRLGIGAKYILVPSDLEEAASNLFNRNTNLDETWLQKNKLTIIPVWYWTDANDWALVADPADITCIEVGFLDGQEEPEMFVQDNPTVGSMFSSDKLTFKLRHIYGGAIDDYRGLDKSVVA